MGKVSGGQDSGTSDVKLSLSDPVKLESEEVKIPDPEDESGIPYTATTKWTVTTEEYADYIVYQAQRKVNGKNEIGTFYTTNGKSFATCTVSYTNVIQASDAVTLTTSELTTAF